jgi:hypothetical protein
MNAALFRKEFRDLLPWGVLSLAFGLNNVVQLLLEQVDSTPLGQTFFLLNGENVVLYWLIAFAIGTGLAVREHDDRTLAFLDGLPVSRSRVFFVKCAVMTMLILAGPLLELAAIGGLHLLSRGSLDRDLHGTVLLQALALQALFLSNGLMLGAAFGRLRSLAWAAAGLAVTAVILFIDRVPRASLLNPLTLLDWQWTTAAIVVDGETVRTQVAVTVVAALLAWHGFVRAGKGRVSLNLSGPVAGALVAVATIGTLGTALVMVMRPFDASRASVERPGEGRYQFEPSPPALTETRHYRISYLAHEADAVLALAAEADEVFERVHELLGVPPGDVIDVDASGSAPNTHGMAFQGRLTMELSTDSEVLAVLAHETAHVASHRVAGDQRDWLWQAAGTLNEGLASWVETRFRARVERGDERMLLLAAMQSRRELLIEELADPLLVQRVRDVSVQYAAGEALFAALVRVYGEGAVARLLQAFADPRLPSDLRGYALWQSTFQLAGFDLGAVVDELYRDIEEYAKANADRIAALPRPRVVLVRLGGSVGAMLVLDASQGDAPEHPLVIRFRAAPDSPLTDLQRFSATPNEPVWPRARSMLGGRVCVQAGVEIGGEALFEPWTCLPTSEAVDYADLLRQRNTAGDGAR